MIRQRHKRTHQAFTLIELIVVIMIIGLLTVILVPTLDALVGGKGLKMARNSLSGYFDGLRSTAVNENKGILIALLPGDRDAIGIRDDSITYPIVSSKNGKPHDVTVNAGFIAFAVVRDTQDGGKQRKKKAWERLRYLERDFIFTEEFTEDVQPHKHLVSRLAKTKRPEIEGVPSDDIAAIGIPKNAYLIYIRPDGRALFPGDIPGYIVDHGDPEQIDADIVFEDGQTILFLDLSTLLRVRGSLIDDAIFDPSSKWSLGGGE